MGIANFNDLMARVSSEYWRSQPIYGDQVATTNPANLQFQGGITTQTLPSSLPSGVTSFIPTSVSLAATVNPACFIVGKLVNMGSINIATPTYTAGSSMPSPTVFGTSTIFNVSPIFCQVTTVLNATPGSLTITYTDQDENASEAGPALSLTASSIVNTIFIYPLNVGDWGVVQIDSATRTGGTTPTGVIQFWGMVPICVCQTISATTNAPIVESILTYDFNFVELGASDQIGIFNSFSNAAKTTTGHIFLVGDS